jgi:hypothetical protein
VPSPRTSSYTSSGASICSVQPGSAHSHTNAASSDTEPCALSAIRSFTSRKSDSVFAIRTSGFSISSPDSVLFQSANADAPRPVSVRNRVAAGPRVDRSFQTDARDPHVLTIGTASGAE